MLNKKTWIMLILEFRNSLRALINLCDIYGIEKGVEVLTEILADEDRQCKNDFLRIADSGWPYQDTARKYASLVLAYACKDLRDMVLRNQFSDAVKIVQSQIRLVAKLL